MAIAIIAIILIAIIALGIAMIRSNSSRDRSANRSTWES